MTPGPSNNNAVTSTTIRDRGGNVRKLFYDAKSQLVLDRVSSGQAPDKKRPSAGSYNAPGAPVRADDPAAWETRHAYNVDGLRISSVLPEENDEQFTYDSANPSRRQQGNLLQQVRNPGPRGADQPNLTESWTYGTPFGGRAFWTTYTDSKGRTAQRTFDGSGNVTSRTEPTVTEGVLGGGSLTVQESWSYNAAGQVSGHLAPDGRADAFTYHTSGPQAGYLASAVIGQGGRNLTTSYTWDESGNLSAKTDPRGATTYYAYDSRNRLIRTQATAPLNYVTLIERDEAGQPTKVARQNVDEAGAPRPKAWIVARSSYDTLGRLVSEKRERDDGTLVGPLKHYDANGRVTKVESAAARAGDSTGSVDVTLYDTRGKLWKTTRGFGTASATTDEIVYDGNGDVTLVRRGLEGPAGPRVTTTTRDGYGRVTSVVDPMGVASLREFDATGNPVSEWVNGSSGLGELSRRTTYYNQRDIPYRSDVAHFGPGNVAIGDGQSTTLSFFDAMGNQVATTDDGGAQTVSTYERPSWLASRTDALSNATTFTRDAEGQVVSSTATETSALGSPPATFTQSATFDLLGRQTSQTDSAGNTTQKFYDSRGNIVKTIDANGNVVLYTYDTLDQLVRTDATMTADGTGASSPIGTVTTLQAFDASGRLVTKTDPNGNVTAFHYDALDRLVRTVFADWTQELDEYNAYGNLVRTIDANGTVATMAYDDSGRMVARTIALAAGIEGATFENYQYDGLGQITRAENDHSVVSLAYDSLGNVLSETSVVDGVSVTTSASYDGLGNQRALTYPSGRTVNRTHDSLQRIVGIKAGARSLATYSWIGPGTRRERTVFGNATRVDYTFDTLGRVTRMTHKRGASGLPFEDREYGWDMTSHVTSRDDLLASTTHDLDYDSLYRLRQSVKPGEAVDYALDAAGNRTSVTDGFGVGLYNLAPASMNRYAATPADTRTYDNAGSLRQIAADATSRQLASDYRGRVTRVSGTGVPTTTFRYDALGRRISKESVASGTTKRTYYRHFGKDIVESRIEDVTAGSHRVVNYVHGALLDEVVQVVEVADSVQGGPCACQLDYNPVTCNGVVYANQCQAECAGCGSTIDEYWLHADLNGNVIAALDASGAQMERYTYTDYGQPTVIPSNHGQLCACTHDYNPVTCNGVLYANECQAECAGCGRIIDEARYTFLFQGRLYDPEIGLYDFRNRSYDPKSGRFVSRDPLGLWGDPVELGVGDAFVGNDPWNSTDPMGLDKITPGELIILSLECAVCIASEGVAWFSCVACAAGIADGIAGSNVVKTPHYLDWEVTSVLSLT